MKHFPIDLGFGIEALPFEPVGIEIVNLEDVPTVTLCVREVLRLPEVTITLQQTTSPIVETPVEFARLEQLPEDVK